MSPKLDLAGIPERRDTVVLVLLCYKIWIKSSPDQSWQAFQTGYRLREAMSPKLDLAGIPERRDTVVVDADDLLLRREITEEFPQAIYRVRRPADDFHAVLRDIRISRGIFHNQERLDSERARCGNELAASPAGIAFDQYNPLWHVPFSP